METPNSVEQEQALLWNGTAGEAWVQLQSLLDGMFQPFEDRLVEALPAGASCRVLDIGCGTGATTLALARRLGADGGCLGVDLSAPMIGLAQTRATLAGSDARFLCADAQSHAFEPASFGRLVSRFGVMFFADPVAAFGNLHRAARPGAALHLIVWRGPAENPFMTAAERAAAPWLPALPTPAADAPGQFAFADRARVSDMLAAAGWSAIDIRPLDRRCHLPASALELYYTRMGMLARRLPTLPEVQRRQVLDSLPLAFEPYVDGDTVRFTAACWEIVARA